MVTFRSISGRIYFVVHKFINVYRCISFFGLAAKFTLILEYIGIEKMKYRKMKKRDHHFYQMNMDGPKSTVKKEIQKPQKKIKKASYLSFDINLLSIDLIRAYENAGCPSVLQASD